MWILLFLVLIIIIIRIIIKICKEGFSCSNYPRNSLDVMFDATFKPECCPTPYSSSSGCLCPTKKDAGLIISRGGNIDEC